MNQLETGAPTMLTSKPFPHSTQMMAPETPATLPGFTGGEGQFTQWVHCEFVVGFETIRLAHTQQVSSERFQKVPTNSPNPNPAGHF